MKELVDPDGDVIAWVDDEDYARLAHLPWRVDKRGLVYHIHEEREPGQKKPGRTYLHYAVMELPVGARCTHLTKPESDCRRANLVTWDPTKPKRWEKVRKPEGIRDMFKKRIERAKELTILERAGDEDAASIMVRFREQSVEREATKLERAARVSLISTHPWQLGEDGRCHATLTNDLEDARPEAWYSWRREDHGQGGRKIAKTLAVREQVRQALEGFGESQELLNEIGIDWENHNRPEPGVTRYRVARGKFSFGS